MENEKISAEIREFVRKEDSKINKRLDDFNTMFIRQSHENQIAMLEVSNALGGLTKAIDGMVEQTGKREKYVDGKLEEQDIALKEHEKAVADLQDTRKDRHERNRNMYKLILSLLGNTAFIGFLFWLLSKGSWSPF
ncbi:MULTISPECIES: hypothetical protein [Bacillaceae]|uniref:Uncharacterized protein n=2 Tax=Bacillaceae TaxID=186817 RepID=A0A9D5I128_9BACI|nr:MULTISPECIES: hypothetical protein [Bacillaceae]KQL57247.1 hypothetical protein AN965_09875 [Alkalicoccobacillus plakortidis]WDF02969.1 hypothetical protein PQ477_15900 [Shouchella hunanensis]